MMNYMSMHVAEVTKVTIERNEYGVRLKLHGADDYPMQQIFLQGVNDFVKVDDLTVPPQVEPMIVL